MSTSDIKAAIDNSMLFIETNTITAIKNIRTYRNMIQWDPDESHETIDSYYCQLEKLIKIKAILEN